MRSATLLVMLAGCGFQISVGAEGDAGLTPDTSIVGLDTADGATGCGTWSLSPTGLDPCALAPAGPLDLCTPTKHVYRTDTGLLDGQAGPTSVLDTARTPAVRIVAVDRLVVCTTTTLQIVGTYPVVFVVHGAADISGAIEASSWLDGSMWRPGPGGEIACSSGTGATAGANSGGAGGGGGGGFGGLGGVGGTSEGQGGARGVTEGDVSLLPLRGGCAGGAGGSGGGAGGPAGPGGGAIQIAVRDQLTINGQVRAGGGPGEGGRANNGGGGGGGAGGAIILEAGTLVIASTAGVCANGGGGGGGANDNGVGSGNNGGDGSRGTCANAPAMPGAGAPSNGQRGGAGGFANTAAQSGLGADEGGGGGGGSVGRIKVRSVAPLSAQGVITPPAQ